VCGGAVATPQFRRTRLKTKHTNHVGPRAPRDVREIEIHFSSFLIAAVESEGRRRARGLDQDRRTAGRAGVSVTPRPPWSIATVASDHARLPPGSLPAAGRPPSQQARIVEGNSINNGL